MVTVRASPEKKAAVLADYRNKKVTSATALAKAHGLSRSSVYRILQAEQHRTEVEAAKGGPTATGAVTGQPKTGIKAAGKAAAPADDESDDGSDGQSAVSNNFFYRSSRFADDLGLAEAGGRPTVGEPQEDAEEREEMLDSMMNVIVGQPAGRPAGPPGAGPPPQFLDDFMDKLAVGPEPLPRKLLAAVPPQVPDPAIDRPDVTQRIIFNVEHFGPLVKTITGPDPQAFLDGLAKRSDRELAGLLTTLERTRSVGNIAAGFKQTFYVVAQATEATSRFIGMRPEGFTDRLRAQDAEIAMIMKEVAIDQWERVKAMDSPQVRLGVLFCMTLAQTDAQNRIRDQLAQVKAAKVSAKVVEAAADL